MTQRCHPLLSALAGAGVACLIPSPASAAEPSPPLPDLINQSCLDCHDDTSAKGGLDLTSLPFDLSTPALRDRWVRIHDRVRKGEMPPDASDLPEAKRQALVTGLSSALTLADKSDILAHGRGTLRRLTREEYEQNLRDVLRLPSLDVRDRLPEDRESHHFTKTAATLDLSRVQLAAYLDASEAALRQAMASGLQPPPETRYHALATGLFQEAETFGNREAMFYARDSKVIPLSGKELWELRKSGQHDPAVEMALFRSAHWPYYGYPAGFTVRLDGDYRVRFSARAVVQVPGYELKPAPQSVPMTFRARKPSGADVSGDVRATGGLHDITPEVRVREAIVSLRKGETFEYSLLGLPVPLARNVDNGPPTYRYPPLPEGGQPGVAFQWIEVAGPLAPESWPPPSHRVLFDELPLQPAPSGSALAVEVAAENPAEEASRLFRRFAGLAARQPLSDEDLAPFDALIQRRLEDGAPLGESLLTGFQAFLSSGHFIYLPEPRSAKDTWAVASRLSHFLTNSRPDAGLAESARTGRLTAPGELSRQTARLVASPGFERFVACFTDSWLSLRHLKRDDPDIRLYPEYRFDEYLVESMGHETRAFFSALIRDNLPVRNIIQADFAFVNDRLARHYGLPSVEGSAPRRVPLPEGSPYGGLLTQAALLKVTANGTTTSPVLRGAWVMERLIGEPPPPPPASVPAVEPDIRGARTIREILARHTASESCASCHARFDPVGFALESFDILGGWRTRYRGLEEGERVSGIDRAGHDYAYTLGTAVDPGGQLAEGQAFHDIHELKALLLKDPRRLARNLLHQFTLYATGTPVRFSERGEIERLLDLCQPGGYRVADLLHAFVQSPLFHGGETGEETSANASVQPFPAPAP